MLAEVTCPRKMAWGAFSSVLQGIPAQGMGSAFRGAVPRLLWHRSLLGNVAWGQVSGAGPARPARVTLETKRLATDTTVLTTQRRSPTGGAAVQSPFRVCAGPGAGDLRCCPELPGGLERYGKIGLDVRLLIWVSRIRRRPPRVPLQGRLLESDSEQGAWGSSPSGQALGRSGAGWGPSEGTNNNPGVP